MTPDFPPPDDDTLLAAGRRALHELPDAPEWMILRAEALDSPRARPEAALAPDLLRRVQALLSVDSWAGAAPVLRGAAGTRQLLFNAGNKPYVVYRNAARDRKQAPELLRCLFRAVEEKGSQQQSLQPS